MKMTICARIGWGCRGEGGGDEDENSCRDWVGIMVIYNFGGLVGGKMGVRSVREVKVIYNFRW